MSSERSHGPWIQFKDEVLYVVRGPYNEAESLELLRALVAARDAYWPTFDWRDGEGFEYAEGHGVYARVNMDGTWSLAMHGKTRPFVGGFAGSVEDAKADAQMAMRQERRRVPPNEN